MASTKRFWATALITAALIGPLLIVHSALALPTTDTSYGLNGTNGTASAAGFTSSTNAQEDLNKFIGTIIKTGLGFLGVIFMMLIIWAGQMWMTASGNEEKIKTAESMIFNAAVGLMVTLAAYLGTDFILKFIFSISNTS